MDASDYHDLRRRLEAAERAIANLPQRLAVAPEKARFYLARICSGASSSSASPSSSEGADAACAVEVYEITFVDGTFDKAAGNGTLTITNRGPTRNYAAAEEGSDYTQGDIVAVYDKNGRWWILARVSKCAGNCPESSSSSVSASSVSSSESSSSESSSSESSSSSSSSSSVSSESSSSSSAAIPCDGQFEGVPLVQPGETVGWALAVTTEGCLRRIGVSTCGSSSSSSGSA